MKNLLILSFVGVLLPVTSACITKGDNNVNPSNTTREGGSLCHQYCDAWDEECGAPSTCVDQCLDDAESCEENADRALECFLEHAFRCRSSGPPTPSGDCDSDFVAWEECQANRGGPNSEPDPGPDPSPPPNGECVRAFGECTQTNDCCDDALCIGDGNTGVCRPPCNDHADCNSACCVVTGDGNEVCGEPEHCAPVPAAWPCLSDSDCASDLCIDDYDFCVGECSTQSDCGVNSQGVPNPCSADDDESGFCFPGCQTTEDCDRWFFDRTLDTSTECVDGACIDTDL